MINKSGQSLVQVLISIAIMAILMMVFSAMVTHLMRQNAHLSQRLAAMDAARNLTGIFADGSVCTYVLTQPTVTMINPTSLPDKISVNSIPMSANASAPTVIVKDDATPVSSLDSNVVATAIDFTGFTCVDGACSASTTKLSANLVVTFDTSKLISFIPPLSFPLVINIDSSFNVQNCNGSNGLGAIDTQIITSSQLSCGYDANCPLAANTGPSIAICPTGSQVTGCGYTLSWDIPQVTADPIWHTNSPSSMVFTSAGDGCTVTAGPYGPGCGVCFLAQAFCATAL